MKLAEKIAFIGPGVMAEALITALIRTGASDPDQLIAAGPGAERGRDLVQRFQVAYERDNAAAARQAGVVLLSVKPQKLDRVLAGLKEVDFTDKLVLSFVAGAPIQKISAGLNHPSVVRAMPNTPAQIGEGITVWTASEAVTPSQQETARRILAAVGQEIQVEEESYLDMATALSGTGPAYVFLFLEAMVDSGVHLGLPRRIAEQMVLQTFQGSLDYYRQSKLHPAALRNQVTSPGGTSAAALYYLEKAGFRTAVSRAVWAAFERSQELGRGGASHAPEKASAGDG